MLDSCNKEVFPGLDKLPKDAIVVVWKDKIAVTGSQGVNVFNRNTSLEVPYKEDTDGCVEFVHKVDSFLLAKTEKLAAELLSYRR